MAIELSPTQVQRTDFPVSKKGYDVDAVRAHLRDAAAALENALRRAKLAEDRARRAEESLAQLSQAQQAAAVPERQLAEETERVLRTARESAAAIEEEARRKAEQMIAEAQQQAAAEAAEANARAQQAIQAAEERARQLLAQAESSAASSGASASVLEDAQRQAAQIVAEARQKASEILRAAEEEKAAKFKELQERAATLEQRRKEALAELERRREQALKEIEAKKEELRALRSELGIKKKKKTKSGRIVSGAIEEAREVAASVASTRESKLETTPGESEEEAVKEAIASVEGTLAATAKETVEAPAAMAASGKAQDEEGSEYEALFSRFKEGGERLSGPVQERKSGPVVQRESGPVPTPAVARRSGPLSGATTQRPSGPIAGIPSDQSSTRSIDTDALLSTSVEIPVPQGAEIEVPEAQAKIVAVLRKQLVRKLKRALQEEQNVVVEMIQKSGGSGDPEKLVPGRAEMTKRVRNQVDTVLFELAKLGWSAAGGAGEQPVDARSEAIVTARLVDPIRAQLVAVVAEGQAVGESAADLCDRVHNVFRVWKGPELADLAAFLAHEVFTAGQSASVGR